MDNVHDQSYQETHIGEEEHNNNNEKLKPVLRKVKDRVKKIKNTLGKNTKRSDDHGMGREEEAGGYEEDSDEEEEVLDHQVPHPPLEETLDSEKRSRDDEQTDRPPIKDEVSLAQVKGGLQEDPSLLPLKGNSSQAAGAKTHPPPTGVEEVSMSPTIDSFKAMKISEEEKGGEGGSYTEKVTSAATAAKDAAASAAARAAEYGKTTASGLYGKMAEAGMAIKGTVMKRSEGEGEERGVPADKGVSVKEYVAEKLRPGEDDKALSEVISETIRGKTSAGGEVAVHEVHEKEADVEKKEAHDDEAKTEETPGMMQKIKGAVTSLFGSTVPPSAAPGSPSEAASIEGEKKSG